MLNDKYIAAVEWVSEEDKFWRKSFNINVDDDAWRLEDFNEVWKKTFSLMRGMDIIENCIILCVCYFYALK